MTTLHQVVQDHTLKSWLLHGVPLYVSSHQTLMMSWPKEDWLPNLIVGFGTGISGWSRPVWSLHRTPGCVLQ